MLVLWYESFVLLLWLLFSSSESTSLLNSHCVLNRFALKTHSEDEYFLGLRIFRDFFFPMLRKVEEFDSFMYPKNSTL